MKRFSASSAAQLMACPAAANLDAAIPGWIAPIVDPTAGQKGVGTARHAMLEPLMELSARDLEHMARVVAYVAELRKRRRFKVLVEQTMEASWLDGSPKTTADVVLYTQDELHIVDFKWGKIPVEVDDNAQMLYYAVTYGPLAPKAKGATMHLLQPYADIYEERFADTNVLAQFMAEARAAQKRILSGDTTFGPSDHCKFCPAYPHSRSDKGRPLCPATLQILYPPAPVHEDEILSL